MENLLKYNVNSTLSWKRRIRPEFTLRRVCMGVQLEMLPRDSVFDSANLSVCRRRHVLHCILRGCQQSEDTYLTSLYALRAIMSSNALHFYFRPLNTLVSLHVPLPNDTHETKSFQSAKQWQTTLEKAKSHSTTNGDRCFAIIPGV